MNTFREYLQSQSYAQPSDRVANRFLESCDKDGERAARQFINSERFKIDVHASDIRINDIEHLLRMNFVGIIVDTSDPSCPPVRDRQGRLIYQYVGRNVIPSKISIVDLVRLLVYNHERFDELCEASGVDEITFIADLQGWTLSNFSPQIEKIAADLASQRYPGRHGPMIVLHAPWYFRAAWGVVRHFVSKGVADKLVMCGSPADAFKHIDPANLPTNYGGTLSYDIETYIQFRHEVEGVEMGTPVTHIMNPSIIHELGALEQHTSEVLKNAIKSGHLEKRGAGGMLGTTTWKKRFFVVSANHLLYFENDKAEGKAHRTWDLRGAQVEPSVSDKSHAFAVNFDSGRRLLLAAKNDGDREGWVELLHSVAYGAAEIHAAH